MNDSDANANLLIRADAVARARRFDNTSRLDDTEASNAVPPVFDPPHIARTMNSVEGAFRDATYASAVEYIGPSLPMRVLRWIAERTFSQAVAVAAVIAAIVALIYSRTP